MAKNEKNKRNPVLWFLIAIVIPVVFALILAYFIFSMAGVDVGGWVKEKVATNPVVSAIVKMDDEKELISKNEKLEEKLNDLEEENEDLQEMIDNLEETNDELETDILKEEKKSENADEMDSEDDEEDEETKDILKQMSGSFKDMDPEKAAKIIESLNQDTATGFLEKMPNKVRGKVLEEMDPKISANLMQNIVDIEQ